jgi:hypothetical protein
MVFSLRFSASDHMLYIYNLESGCAALQGDGSPSSGRRLSATSEEGGVDGCDMSLQFGSRVSSGTSRGPISLVAFESKPEIA